ncbi:phosphatase PAP2 family protein [uncultured Algibacter sp.]|uniref:phosphatase PAP2 family protein n=1 Tax=uncultured Algibacter sp. TaxID=298659 RepID=UPI00261AC975|nr:phosphatase PAP2 family protein [uncultured Algibacter sp.]
MFCRKLFFVLLAILFQNLYLGFAQKSDIEMAGDIGVIVVPIAGLTTTLIKGDNKGTWQFAKGFLLNQVVTFGLKASISKTRPDFSDNNAFPSGHTSTVFQGASFIHRRYGFKYSIPAYAIAGFTAFSRQDAKKHDMFDILVGAIIGIGSTCLFTTPYQEEHLKLSFNSYDGNYLMGFIYKF